MYSVHNLVARLPTTASTPHIMWTNISPKMYISVNIKDVNGWLHLSYFYLFANMTLRSLLNQSYSIKLLPHWCFRIFERKNTAIHYCFPNCCADIYLASTNCFPWNPTFALLEAKCFNFVPTFLTKYQSSYVKVGNEIMKSSKMANWAEWLNKFLQFRPRVTLLRLQRHEKQRL